MFKKILFSLLILASIIALSGCNGIEPKHDNLKDDCAEKKQLTDLFIKRINNIANSITQITEEDTRYLVKYLTDKFKLDEGSCTGYTLSVKEASERAIKKRYPEIRDPLLQICNENIDPKNEIRDVSLLAKLNEERRGAIKGLQILEEPTDKCFNETRF